MVLQAALGTNTVLRLGKVFNNNEDKNLSSPNNNKFFLCKVSVMLSEYLSTISGFARIGTQKPSLPFGVYILYIEKQPRKQVTDPNTDSKALD